MSVEFLRAPEAARLLGISKASLYRNSRIPKHKIPGSKMYVWLKAELIDFVLNGVDESQQSKVRHRNSLYS